MDWILATLKTIFTGRNGTNSNNVTYNQMRRYLNQAERSCKGRRGRWPRLVMVKVTDSSSVQLI